MARIIPFPARCAIRPLMYESTLARIKQLLAEAEAPVDSTALRLAAIEAKLDRLLAARKRRTS